ncbi:MAG TPA: peptidoglycan-binding domain-containing protein, partial [Myxococcales bacterium]|nr:peptidoglycan-binding domain-containing protein [Myxococcales bacterium]
MTSRIGVSQFVPGAQWNRAEAAVSPPASGAVLRLGSSGPAVTELQKKLNALGENLPVNGTFGPRTQEAVRRFQLAQGIRPANGIVGPETAAALSRPRAGGTMFQASSFQAAGPRTRAPVALSVPQPPAAPARGAPAGSMEDLQLRVFERDTRWKPLYQGPHFGDPGATGAPFHERVSQRYFVAGGNSLLTGQSSIYTETHVVANATAENLVSELSKQTFWSGGKVENWREHPDGTRTYVLKPAGLSLVEVHEKMYPPLHLPDGSWVLRVDMSPGEGSAAGRAYFLVKPRPGGGCDVYGRFADVNENSAL